LRTVKTFIVINRTYVTILFISDWFVKANSWTCRN